jgi:hypothetical protein
MGTCAHRAHGVDNTFWIRLKKLRLHLLSRFTTYLMDAIRVCERAWVAQFRDRNAKCGLSCTERTLRYSHCGLRAVPACRRQKWLLQRTTHPHSMSHTSHRSSWNTQEFASLPAERSFRHTSSSSHRLLMILASFAPIP